MHGLRRPRDLMSTLICSHCKAALAARGARCRTCGAFGEDKARRRRQLLEFTLGAGAAILAAVVVLLVMYFEWVP